MNSPKKINVMGIGNLCIQNCNHCYYQEIGHSNKGSDADIDIIRKIKSANPDSLIFPYPRDIGNSLGLLKVMPELNVSWGMTNGRTLSEENIQRFIDAGIVNLKITLFSNENEQLQFNNNSPEEYRQIKQGIELAVKRGISVDIFNVLDKKTGQSIADLANLTDSLGGSRLKFFKLFPVGNATHLQDSNYLEDSDMDSIVESFEKAKIFHPGIYFSFGTAFGLNFYGKTINEAQEKINRGGGYPRRVTFPCPAINDDNAVISIPTSEIYWCIFLVSDKEKGIIGKLEKDGGHILLDNSRVDLSQKTLSENLRGDCTRAICEYQEVCMGGCRVSAYLFAKLNGEKDPLYAGMDSCLTNVYRRIMNRK